LEDGFKVIDSSFWEGGEPKLMGVDVELEEWLLGREEFLNQVLFRSSGSSGEDKWVALSKKALEWSARNVIAHLSITAADVLGLALPTRHVGGFGLAARAYFSGARLVEFEKAWSPGEFASWCDREKISVTSLVPTQVSDLVRRGVGVPGALRVVVVGGGSLDDALRDRALMLGWPVQASYGMTETSSQVATGVGLPLMRGWEARIENGRLALKGGGLLSWLIQKKTGTITYADPKKEGWFLTNDLAELEGEKLRILGRSDRQVKILGELVDLERVEKKWQDALACPVAVIKRRCERRGVSLWLLAEGRSGEMDLLNQQMPGLERLSGWAFVESLPRGALGKIDRRGLNEIHVEYDCAEKGSGLS